MPTFIKGKREKEKGKSGKELYKLFTFNCIACEFHMILN